MSQILIAGEALDWIADVPGTNLVSGMGLDMQNIDINEGRQNHVMGMKNVVDAVEQALLESGADLHLSCECTALVVDGDEIVGVQASEDGSDVYFKGSKGVILCAGGIGMNKTC
jgi:phytoene dehydrogenase-like protein